MRYALAAGLAALAAVAAVAASSPASSPAPAHTAGAALDFGDAPDGARARYAGKPRLLGRFPSRSARGGPRHPSTGPRLGSGWSGESDSRQVDRDRDDGAQLNPRRCALSTLTVTIDASRADPAQPLYVNAWFDWNRDGDWADGGTLRCGPEWGLQNQEIDPASLGPDRVAVVTLRFRGGRVPSQFWWRVQVHQGSPVPHAGGGGQALPTSGGETEDWLYSRLPVPPPRVAVLRCTPTVGIINHGRAQTLTYSFAVTSGATLTVLDVDHSVQGLRDGVDIKRTSSPSGRTSKIKVTSTREHDRQSQVLYIRLDVEALLDGRRRDFDVSCRVRIDHTERIAPPFEPPQELGPVQRGGGGNPPDPVSARCALRFERFPDSGPGGRIQVRCDGADAKTISASAGSTSQRITDVSSDRGSCGTRLNARSARCNFAPPNRGIVLTMTYNTNQPFPSTRLHVLGGGRGAEGTTILLQQDYFFSSQGVRCQQLVPRAAQCASL